MSTSALPVQHDLFTMLCSQTIPFIPTSSLPRILHSMDGYVSDAAAYCPGEVDALHDPRLTARPSSTRSPGRDTARARTPHAPLPRAASRGRDGAPGTDAKGASSSLDPNPHADNVGPTPARHTPTTPARAASKQARKVTHRPRMAESSDASPSESSSPDDTPPKQRGQAGLQQRAHGFQPKQTHGSHGSPRRAEMVQDPYTGVWTQKGFEAAVGYPVSSLLDEPDQLQGSTGHGSSPLRQRTGGLPRRRI